MEDIGLLWNERKCDVVHMKGGRLQESEKVRIGEGEVIASQRRCTVQIFGGVRECKTTRQLSAGGSQKRVSETTRARQ